MQNFKLYKFRCPSCRRLYESDAKDIQVHNPQFECVTCKCHFGFFVPTVVTSEAEISCFIVSKMAPTSVATSTTFQNENQLDDFRQDLKKQLGASLRKTEQICPKCGAAKFESATECYSCGVIFSRLEGLPSDPNLKAQPSLVKKWKEVLQDYSNDSKHETFVMACADFDALPFAKFKYQEIKSLQGVDLKAEQMLQHLEARMGFQAKQTQPQNEMATEVVSQITDDTAQATSDFVEKLLHTTPDFLHEPILQILVLKAKLQPILQQMRPYLPYTPYMISGILILWGLFSLANRNMVGLGVAIAMLSFGWKNWLSGKNYSS